MKLSFSTLGCPDWNFSEIISTAKDLGFDGIEVRGVSDQLYAPHIKAFSNENIERTKNNLLDKNVKICCLTSACYLHLDDRDYMSEAREYIDLAEKLSCPYIRVMGEVGAEPSENFNDGLFTQRLKELCSYAQPKGVTLLIENNGVYADSQRLMSIINAVKSTNIGIIWDIQHSCRNYGEDIEYTYNIIKKYVKHIHLKDSALENGNNVYKMIGKGTLPVKEVITLLKKNNFQGYLSLEWLKRYYNDLEDAGIVFARYISLVKSYSAE